MTRTWLITGAGRGMGSEIAKAALVAGHNVVATGRNVEKVTAAFAPSDKLLVAKLDVTSRDDAIAAVKAAEERFGRIDVLVNNAAAYKAGFFEELSPEQMDEQFQASVFGAMNVTRAVLPGMRARKAGRIITVSSTASIFSTDFLTAYSASKYATDGWMRGLGDELRPFGIETMTVTPGFFRTTLLSKDSMNFGDIEIADYDERRKAQIDYWTKMDGQQSGDPEKLARALITLDMQDNLPRRFLAGADALQTAEAAAKDLMDDVNAWKQLSASLDAEGAKPLQVGEAG